MLVEVETVVEVDCEVEELVELVLSDVEVEEVEVETLVLVDWLVLVD